MRELLPEQAIRVRQIRAHYHLTQRELAKAIGVSTGFISLVETGKSGFSEQNMENLCKALHVSAVWLKDGTGAMESENPEDWIVESEDEEEKQKRFDAIADRIRELRQTLHLTQREFGAGMGSSREIVAAVEQRKCRASETLMNKIEKGYGVSRGWLREGRGEMYPTPDSSCASTSITREMTAEDEVEQDEVVTGDSEAEQDNMSAANQEEQELLKYFRMLGIEKKVAILQNVRWLAE